MNLTPQQARAIHHMEILALNMNHSRGFTHGMAVKGMPTIEKPEKVSKRIRSLTPLSKEDRQRLKVALEGRYVSHVAAEVGIDEGVFKSAMRGFKLSERSKTAIMAWLGDRE